ncbi:hypothetical protein BDK51DRAFT_44313 [Blyttiomyces helicus]|uniref:Uncharacterized protein n=1 Tax=Blyttiomyces helicus TaxID=388810 RepID=A0A4P9WN04_9FUNG|nr:hypothetical protein BDK51DRAFT_44313 [Blyttiomyces helicus]|eukprot:RKO93625.1 hypothetical protein BDK51DRAFT_44313 [Blyttiomyces helicus]
MITINSVTNEAAPISTKYSSTKPSNGVANILLDHQGRQQYTHDLQQLPHQVLNQQEQQRPVDRQHRKLQQDPMINRLSDMNIVIRPAAHSVNYKDATIEIRRCPYGCLRKTIKEPFINSRSIRFNSDRRVQGPVNQQEGQPHQRRNQEQQEPVIYHHPQPAYQLHRVPNQPEHVHDDMVKRDVQVTAHPEHQDEPRDQPQDPKGSSYECQ